MLWVPGVFRGELYEDDDGAKDLNRLCGLCENLRFAFTSEQPITTQQLIHPAEPAYETPRIPHHNDVASLIESARSGCHLCTVIVGGLCKDSLYADNKFSNLSHAQLLARVRSTFKGQVFISAYQGRTMLIVYDCERSRTSLQISDGAWQGREDQADANTSEYYGRKDIASKLDICRISHGMCVLQDSTFTPTRLIDIREGLHSLRLVSNAQPNSLNGQAEPLASAEYATLSHRWLLDLACKTTSLNIADYHTLIPAETLPRHFRDAILLARYLKLSFVWIDSLCIMQEGDGGLDWNNEAPKMAAIYRNAALNISIDTKDVSNGFLPINLREIQSCNLSAFPGCSVSPWTPANQHALDLGGLEDRGWTLQERLLPRRIVHCTPWGMIWECYESHKGFHAQAFERTLIRLNQASHALNRLDTDQSLTRPDLYNVWTRIIERYSRRNLTVPTDRLVAVCGIAKQLSAMEPGITYLAGLWLEAIPSQLGWFTERENVVATKSLNKHGRRLKGLPKYCAPSFSWASVDCEVSFIPTEILHSQAAQASLDTSIREKYKPDMISYKVESPNNEPFGFVKSAEITLKGLSTTPASFSEHVWVRTESEEAKESENKHLLGTSGLLVMDDESLAWLQDLHQLPSDAMLFMICDFPLVVALVLVPDGQGSVGTLRRIGLWQLFYEECPGGRVNYELWSEATVTIV